MALVLLSNPIRENAKETFQYFYEQGVEIKVISGDNPVTVSEIAKGSKYTIRFSTNDVNLGYDMNLGAIIKKARGEFVFLMSDDDALTEGCLNEIIPILKSNESVGVFYAPFVYKNSGKKDRNRGNKNFRIIWSIK